MKQNINKVKFDYYFKDTEYPFVGVDHTREIVRAILLNDKNEVCLEYIFDDDMFGHRDYYETPGGGVKPGETHEEALIRECAEECGFIVKVERYIASVHDYYNLIKRENHNYFYLCRVVGTCEKHQEPDEIKRVKGIDFYPIDTAIEMYKNMQDELVGKIVKQRELPILQKVRDMIK